MSKNGALMRKKYNKQSRQDKIRIGRLKGKNRILIQLYPQLTIKAMKEMR